MSTLMFIAAIFTIGKGWKQIKCPLMNDPIKKMWHVHRMEWYLALTKKEILSCATAWVNFENSILGEISPSQEDKNT